MNRIYYLADSTAAACLFLRNDISARKWSGVHETQSRYLLVTKSKGCKEGQGLPQATGSKESAVVDVQTAGDGIGWKWQLTGHGTVD